nr:hypothetical protein Itr_chr12CG20060 [Ipomoea trifida]GME05620.1 hypothetical protein Iba_scaffold3049CG1550 [Ipomoea batatas]
MSKDSTHSDWLCESLRGNGESYPKVLTLRSRALTLTSILPSSVTMGFDEKCRPRGRGHQP